MKDIIVKTRNTISKEMLATIPETVQERRLFLNKQLKHFIGKSVLCPALGVTVEFTRASYNETIRNAAISKNSTIAALNVLRLIKNARFVKMDMPLSNKKTPMIEVIHSYFSRCYFLSDKTPRIGVVHPYVS